MVADDDDDDGSGAANDAVSSQSDGPIRYDIPSPKGGLATPLLHSAPAASTSPLLQQSLGTSTPPVQTCRQQSPSIASASGA